MNVDPAIEFPRVEKMLYNLAWSFARKFPYPNEEAMFEECKSEAYNAFMRACQQYDPKRGASFGTWCYKRTWFDLKTFVTRRSTDPHEFVEINDDLLGECPEKKHHTMELLEGLSEDARVVLSLFLESPRDFLGMLPAGRTKQVCFGFGKPHQVDRFCLLDCVKKYLVSRRQMWPSEVDNACEELRSHFSDNLV